MADVTTMVVNVDLKCEKCKKKIKKVLCKISQIENQVYDEKNNAVTITVVCCSPEKIKKKIFCKGGDIIMGIEILKPKAETKPATKPETKPEAKPETKPETKLEAKPETKPKTTSRCDCCREGSVFYVWGPCYPGHGQPWPPCYCSCHGCYGRPVCECWGSGCRRCYVIERPVCECWGSGCRRCYVICEENPTACTIM